MNLDYNIVLISHEDTSRDITKKTGDKITAIKPNVNDKVALKIAGMVDIVGRVVNDEGSRIVSFKTNEVIFGGGRLPLTVESIECSYPAIEAIYGKPVNKNAETATVVEPSENEKGYPESWDEVKPEPAEEKTETTGTRRTRRVRS